MFCVGYFGACKLKGANYRKISIFIIHHSAFIIKKGPLPSPR